MNQKLIDILVCPVTKGPLRWNQDKTELISLSARLAYPIEDDFPVLLEERARELTDEEIDAR